MFSNCIYEFVCEQSCADHHCVRGCDHGADVAGRNHDCSCLLTESLTDDVHCLERDEKHIVGIFDEVLHSWAIRPIVDLTSANSASYKSLEALA